MNLDPSTVYDYAVEKVYEHVPGPKRNHGDRLNFRAPCCGDSKKTKSKIRGWIFRNNGAPPSYWCYNCGEGSLAIELVALLENKSVGAVFGDILKENRGQRKSVPVVAATPPPPKPKPEDFEIPNCWIDLENHKDATTVVQNRKIFEAPNLPKNWKLYYSKKTKRIVLPWVRNNNIVYYQERAIYKEDTPKYLFPKVLEKDLFGLDNIDPSFPYIFVLEGAFDAVFCKNGICCGSISITNNQRELLKPYFDFKIVWLFDNQNIDATAKKTIMKLAEKSRSNNFFIWPKSFKAKDVNEHFITTGTNPFYDESFLLENICSSTQASLRLKFNK